MNKNRLPKRKIKLKNAIYILIITTIMSILVSMAKLNIMFNEDGIAKVAVPIFSSTTIDLENIYPDMETKKYTFTVENSKDLKKSEVSLNYIVNIENNGNVPLDIKLYRKENGIISGENLLVNGKTENITISVNEKKHTYELQVEWDKSIPNYKSYEYSGETSSVQINIDSVQKD